MIAEELLGLEGREDRAGLIEDQDVALAVEGLENLDPLAHADRQVLDPGIGVDVQAVLLGTAPRSAAGLRHDRRCRACRDRLRPEGHSLDNIEDRARA